MSGIVPHPLLAVFSPPISSRVEPTARTRGLDPIPPAHSGGWARPAPRGRREIVNECFGSDADEDWRPEPGSKAAHSAYERVGAVEPHERFSATKLGTVFGTAYRRKHSKDAEVLRLTR
jgi:hypothetical protein